jgi:hypothetical protein
MATSAVTFYSSSNGDRWQLITNAETGHHVVREEHLVTFVEIAFIGSVASLCYRSSRVEVVA